jgi:glycosyltransferase involved in cell wall biosynthesis
MRIGVDARELCGHPTGVGRYLSGLLREWSKGCAAHEDEFVLYAHRAPDRTLPFDVRVVPGDGGTVWEQRQLASAIGRDGIDVLFSPAYSTPLFTSVARVVALHDISFAARPEWFRWREGFRRRIVARQSAARARAVITISQFSKREIATRFGVAPDRIHVIPPGVDTPVCAEDREHTQTGTALLYVGSIFNRRHVPDLIAGFGRLAAAHDDARLHIVGDNRSYPHQDIQGMIERESAAGTIEWHQYVSDVRLGQLYRGARGFAFLSEYEGLGLTPLEALSVGIPSLLLDTAVARESCGDAAVYVPRPDVEVVAPAIERLLYDVPTRTALLAAAPSVLARYDWTRAAADTLHVITGAQ